MGKLIVVTGGQFGSEAKGHVAAALADKVEGQFMAIRTGGPNAGHTAYDAEGHKFVFRQLPVAAATRPHTIAAIGAGSEINLEVLKAELTVLPDHGEVTIDGSATILTEEHMEQEAGMRSRIGSTAKGIGAARAARIMRTAAPASEFGYNDHVSWQAEQILARNGTVMLEGTQGYGLGLHTPYYPFTTSADCRPVDQLSQAGISPWSASELAIWLVVRTYPIRVAGNSGPLYRELTWDYLSTLSGGHIQAEKTTVTQLIRRVGGWDKALFRNALHECGLIGVLDRRLVPHAHIALTFADYIDPSIAGSTDPLTVLASSKLQAFVEHRIVDDCGFYPEMICTGPQSHVFLSRDRWDS